MLISDIEIPETLKLTIEIEKAFGNIEEDNIDEVVNLVKQKQLTCQGEIQDLAREFCYDVSIRPGKENLIYEVLKRLLQEESFPKHELLEFKSFRSLGGPFLLRKLLSDNIIDLSYIKTAAFFSTFELLFIPELMQRPNFDIPFYMKEEVEKYYNNDYSKVPDVFLEGWNKNTVGYALKHDDIDMFKSFSTMLDYDINQHIDSSMEISFAHFDGIKSLINVAAFFGATKCFKYLYLNNAVIEPDLPKLAIMGGSNEIIRLCHQKNMKFILGFYSALNFRRYALFDWLVQNALDDMSMYPPKLFFEIRCNLSFLLMFQLGYAKEQEVLYQTIMKSMHAMSVYIISQDWNISDMNLVAAIAEGEDSLLQQMSARGTKLPKKYSGIPISNFK